MDNEYPGEEEALSAYEKGLTEFANGEYGRILKAIAGGHTPDIVDRILLRMARKSRVGKQSKKRRRARR